MIALTYTKKTKETVGKIAYKMKERRREKAKSKKKGNTDKSSFKLLIYCIYTRQNRN